MKLAAILLFTTTAFAATPITGLWVARRDFGPDVRGRLTVQRDGDVWRASIAGRAAAVSVEKESLSFALPGNEGVFRGTIKGGRIAGHWIQPAGVTMGNYATPITLERDSPSQWSGIVTPLDDHMTIFMPVTANADGTLRTFIRNPERNVGRFWNIERIVLDGNRVKLLDKSEQVFAEGTFDAENETIAMWIPSRGGSYDFHRATPADEAAFYPRPKSETKYVYRKPAQRDDGWRVATVDEVGISRDGIAKLMEHLIAMPIDSVHASEIHAVLIARHGKLVLDETLHATDPDEPHDTRSASKSLTSVLIGAAKLDPSTRVYAALGEPAADPRKQALTIEHLLTMSSGLDCDDNDDHSPGNENTMQSQTAQPDWTKYTLDLKMIRDPGQKSVYCSCQPNLAGAVLARKSGRWIPDLFRDLVAEPLQIRRYGINLTPAGQAYMGGGARFRPRDFMKFGQLMIDGGRWNGKQIVSADWAKTSAATHTHIGDREYGYLWWIAQYPYKGRTVRAFFAGGNGGQVVIAIPELDLVIAFYGGNYSDAVSLIPQRELVPQFILPAVQ